MNQVEAARWKSAVLDEVFAALAADAEIGKCLVFKGARILYARLGGGRQSLDLDSNFLKAFVVEHPHRDVQKSYLERLMKRAISRHFERQEPVRFTLNGVAVKTNPPEYHPRGWNAFIVNLAILDLGKTGVRALPRIEIDVAAPEDLLPTSVSTLMVRGNATSAYTLERIAGEKMRAFLSSLPAYRAKLKRPGESVRAKDLYDLARIQQARPRENTDFWDAVGREFQVACRSRYIDCLGFETFTEQWEITAETYTKDPTIPDDIGIDEVRCALENIVKWMAAKGIIPFEYPIPPPTT